MIRAVVFVDPDRLLPNASICIQHCLAMGYHVVGVVRGSWDEVIRLTRTRKAEVVVVAEDDDLPPDRTPRVEIVSRRFPAASEDQAGRRGSLGGRSIRTARIIRRAAGA